MQQGTIWAVTESSDLYTSTSSPFVRIRQHTVTLTAGPPNTNVTCAVAAALLSRTCDANNAQYWAADPGGAANIVLQGVSTPRCGTNGDSSCLDAQEYYAWTVTDASGNGVVDLGNVTMLSNPFYYTCTSLPEALAGCTTLPYPTFCD